MKATLTFSCARLCRSRAWKRRDGLGFALMLNKQLVGERCFSPVFSLQPFIMCLLFATQGTVSSKFLFIMCFWPDLPVFHEPSPPFNSALHFAGSRNLELFLGAWKDTYRRRPRSTKASLPTRPRSVRCARSERESSSDCDASPIAPPHPPPPSRAPDARARLAVVFNFMIGRGDGGGEKSRQNTSSLGGTTEHGNSCGLAVSQVQGISPCAWSQDCLHLYELLQLCPSPGSHFIYTLIGLRCN